MRYLLCITLACLLAPPTIAQDTHPVAVRWWGQGMVSIETWWNLTIVIDPYGEGIGYDVPKLAADLVLVTHEHSDHNNVEAVRGDPIVVRGLNQAGKVREIDAYFDRFENQARPEWWANTEADSAKPTSHSIHVQTIPAWHDEVQGRDRGATAMFLISVDGVRIAHCGDLGQSKLTVEQIASLKHVDVLLLPVGGVYTIDGIGAWSTVRDVQPRIVVPIHYKSDELKIPLEPIRKFEGSVMNNWALSTLEHNTLVISAATAKDPFWDGHAVVLNHEPWQPKGELAKLLGKMDAACRASQEVFAPLSAHQMNWQPPNGSHTPRWNAEHMMGRQLGFFSEIYAAIANKPSFVPPNFRLNEQEIREAYTVIPHLDLNPAQMPPDYTAAHPDWDGAEEARQMERANAYVRRFAYLLDDLDLDAKAPGSFWTPRKLLEQMDRHFGEHTANVKKKFELEDWPEE